MKKVKLVQQVQQSECGLCCVLMLLHFYKSNETLEDLRRILDIGRDGLNMTDLKMVLELKNFKTKVFRTNITSTEEISQISNSLRYPSIIYWKNEHFVVLSRITKKYVEIIDPAYGHRKLAYTEFIENFSGYILEATPAEGFIRKKEKPKRWNYIVDELLKEKKIIIFICIFTLLVYLITILFPKMTQWFVNSYMNVRIKDNTIDLKSLFILTTLSILLTVVIIFIRNYATVIMKYKTEGKLSKNIFNHLINLPYSFFDTRTNGDLLMRLNSVNNVKDFLLDHLIGSFFNLGIGIILLFYLGTISYKILLITLLLISVNCLSIFFTRRPIETLNKEEILNLSKVSKIQVETIYSILNTKLLRLENITSKNWSSCFNEYLEKRKQREFYQMILTSVSAILNVISPFILLIIGYFGYRANIINLGDIIVSQSFIINLLSISTNISNTYNYYLITTNYLDRVVDITNYEAENTSGIELEDIEKISLEAVDFSYSQKSSPVLKNISLEINKGEKVAFIGETGSGKSTLSKLLLGLYQPSSGRILYNDTEGQSVDKKNLLRLITVVPQDLYIYAKTIFENIALDRNNISFEDVENASKTACIYDYINSLPMKYNTYISDMGANLSGGQKQRLIIARALANKAKLVIFDEGTSFLDNLTEKRIMTNLKKNDLTVIMIAHRLESIIDCDRIFVLKNGEIVESGTHKELMEGKGEYYKLYTVKKTG